MTKKSINVKMYLLLDSSIHSEIHINRVQPQDSQTIQTEDK